MKNWYLIILLKIQDSVNDVICVEIMSFVKWMVIQLSNLSWKFMYQLLKDVSIVNVIHI